MAAAEEIVVAVAEENSRAGKQRVLLRRGQVRLLKKDLESACKSMLLLAVDPGLKAEAMPLNVIVTKVEADAVHFEVFPSEGRTCGNEHRHPSFHRAPHRRVLTCCKRIRRGDIFLFAAEHNRDTDEGFALSCLLPRATLALIASLEVVDHVHKVYVMHNLFN